MYLSEAYAKSFGLLVGIRWSDIQNASKKVKHTLSEILPRSGGLVLPCCVLDNELCQEQVTQKLVYERQTRVHLSGAKINAIDFAFLDRFAALESLDLSGNKLQNPLAFSASSTLKYLNLSANLFTEYPDFSGLSALVHLNLSYNPLPDLNEEWVSRFPKNSLRCLDLSHTNLCDPRSAQLAFTVAPKLRLFFAIGTPLSLAKEYKSIMQHAFRTSERGVRLDGAEPFSSLLSDSLNAKSSLSPYIQINVFFGDASGFASIGHPSSVFSGCNVPMHSESLEFEVHYSMSLLGKSTEFKPVSSDGNTIQFRSLQELQEPPFVEFVNRMKEPFELQWNACLMQREKDMSTKPTGDRKKKGKTPPAKQETNGTQVKVAEKRLLSVPLDFSDFLHHELLIPFQACGIYPPEDSPEAAQHLQKTSLTCSVICIFNTHSHESVNAYAEAFATPVICAAPIPATTVKSKKPTPRRS